MPHEIAQLTALHDIAEWLDKNEAYRELINKAVFSTANKMGCHPHDIAIFILIRTASI